MNNNNLKQAHSGQTLARDSTLKENNEKVEKASAEELAKREIYQPKTNESEVQKKNLFFNKNTKSVFTEKNKGECSTGTLKLNKEKPNFNLFNNNQKKTTSIFDSKSSLFNNNKKVEEGKKEGEEKKEGKNKMGSLFNGPSLFDNKSSLFNNKKSETEKTEEKDEKKTDSIFKGPSLFDKGQKSSLFTNNNKTSLFNNDKSDKKEPSSLFNNLKGTSLFGNKDNNNKNSLFSNQNDKTPSIFSNVNKKLFLETKTEEVEKEEDEKEEEVDKEKFKVQYEYKSFYDKLIEKKIINFKIGNKTPFGPGTMTIEKSKENENLYYIAFRNKAQKILHNSMVIPKLSDNKFIKNKNDALILRTFSLEENKEEVKEGEKEKKKMESFFLKIKFNDNNDAKEFKKELDAIYNKQ